MKTTCDNGSIFLWFLPAWNSASAGGAGPGVYGRLIEIGTYSTNASGWWSLYLDPAGTNLFLSSQSNLCDRRRRLPQSCSQG